MSGDVDAPDRAGAAVRDKTTSSHVAITLDELDGRCSNGRQNSTEEETPKPERLKRATTKASILKSIDKSAQVVIRFDNICAWVPTLVIPGGHGGNFSALLGPFRGKGQPSDEPKQQQPPKERQILFNVSGEVSPGEVLALMGPSGGGKTSLLTLLGGRSTARLEGAITFNGARLSKALKRKLGYVSQDDLLFPELTVYETLYFAALLRLPRSWSRSSKLGRVELVVAALGLGRCRDTIIGSPMMRGVSGGERKRVSIGHELLINPSMLLLDEPTSGLDSTTALRLMHTLRSLAGGGRTVVTSIHQPSSRLYRQMDKLMLLSEGRCMYYGDAQSVAGWFSGLGQPCPFGTNIADHILDLANGDVAVTPATGKEVSSSSGGGGGEEEEGEKVNGSTSCRRRRRDRAAGEEEDMEGGEEPHSSAPSFSKTDIHRRLVEAFEQRSIGRGRHGIRPEEVAAMSAAPSPPATTGSAPSPAPCCVTTGGGALAVAAAAAAAGDMQQQPQQQEAAEEEGSGGAVGDDKWGASWIDQVKYLTLRSVKTRRFQSLSHQKTFQLLAVAVLAGMFWWQIGAHLSSSQAVLDVGGLLFFIELFMGFATLFAALFTFPAEFQMLVKERQSGMYRLSAYYVARTLSDLPMDCLLPSLFVAIVYWMAGLRPEAGAFFSCWSSVLLIVLTSQSIGLLIGATVINPQNGQTIATIFMLTTMLVGGYYVRGIPVWIAWLKYASFIYWGWNLLLKIEFRHRLMEGCEGLSEAERAGQGAEALAAGECSVAHAGIYTVNVDEGVQKEVCILIGMLIFLRLCIYFALQYKTTFRGGKR